MHSDRSTSILAIVRIVAVLAMSFCIAAGIFALLGGWWQYGLLLLAGSLPFLWAMRYMEKRASRGEL